MKMQVAYPAENTPPSGRTLILSERAISSLGASFLLMRSGSTIGGYGVVRNRGGALDVLDLLPVPGNSPYIDSRIASKATQDALQDRNHLPVNLIWYIGAQALNISEGCKRATLARPEDEYYVLAVYDGGEASASAISKIDNDYEEDDLAVRWDYGRYLPLANEAKRCDTNAPYVSNITTHVLREENITALDEVTEVARGTTYDPDRFRDAFAALPEPRPRTETPTNAVPRRDHSVITPAETEQGWVLRWLSPTVEVANFLLSRRYGVSAFALRKAMMLACIASPSYIASDKFLAVSLLKNERNDPVIGLAWSFLGGGPNKATIDMYIFDNTHMLPDAVIQLLTSAYYQVRKELRSIKEVSIDKLTTEGWPA